MDFTLVIGNSTWATLTINYFLVGSRPDLIAGHYIADASSLLDCNQQNSAELIIPLSLSVPALPSNAAIGVLVFISGLRTQASLFNLQFLQPRYDTSLRQINVTAVTDATLPI